MTANYAIFFAGVIGAVVAALLGSATLAIASGAYAAVQLPAIYLHLRRRRKAG